jgi:hypothetical protein
MNTNTKQYEESILKKIDTAMGETMEKMKPFLNVKNEDKTPEEVFEHAALSERLGALKVIKAELIRENNNASYTISEDGEVKVMLRLKGKHEESMEAYKKLGRTDLYDHEKAELDVINEFTPAQPTEEDIVNYTKEIIKEFLAEKPSDYAVSMRDMGQIMPKVKAKYPNVNGNIVKTALTPFMK